MVLILAKGLKFMESKKIYCRNCGSEMDENADVCVNCGVALNKNTGVSGGKSKIFAGLLALMFGEFGVDKFYLGYTKGGVARLILFFVSIVLCFVAVGFIGIVILAIWIIVDAVKIFTGKTLDANGNELV